MSSSSVERPLKVLYHLHPDMDTLDITAPLEVLSSATFPASGSPVFINTITAVSEYTTTHQNLTVKRHIPLSEAYATLSTYDILIIPGGASPSVLSGATEPLDLIKAFNALPPPSSGPGRTLLSVCTGSLFLAEAGVLDGLTATTHVFFYDQLRKIAGSRGRTEVVDARFVVNPSKGGEGGLRVVTSGGVSCGMDSCLWLVGDVAGRESMERVALGIQYQQREGVIL